RCEEHRKHLAMVWPSKYGRQGAGGMAELLPIAGEEPQRRRCQGRNGAPRDYRAGPALCVLYSLGPRAPRGEEGGPVASILPETIEGVGAKLRISPRMHDVAVAEVVRERAGIDTVVR